MNIFITALGGDLAQSIVKALRLSKLPLSIVGSDANKESVASIFAEKIYYLPLANDADYIPNLIACLVESKSSVLIPSSEAEILAISNYIETHSIKSFPCPVICQNKKQLQLFNDKLLSYCFLEKFIKIPAFADGHDVISVERFLSNNSYPCIIKGRCTSGSRHMYVVNSKKEFDEKIKITPLPIVQEYIDASHGEYSIGVFVDNSDVQILPFERQLGPVGASWIASTALDKHEIIDYTRELSRHIEMQGSYNVQVRYGKNGIGLLEINPRFSSLVAARAATGFNDVLWSLQKILGIPIVFPEQFLNVKFRRFIYEAIDMGQGLGCLPDWSPKML